MTTQLLFRVDPYLQEAHATVMGHTPEGGILLDRTVFYPSGGGQPGDSGWIEWGDQRPMAIATAVKVDDGGVALVAAEAAALPPIGTQLRQRIDWPRRYRHMRMHTALHLVTVLVPLPVTGGSVAVDKGRLDFDMPEPPADLAALNIALADLIARDLPVDEDWITEDELAANPSLIKTLMVAPPKGQGRVRLVRIGEGADQVDIQPCGGTHVARTGELGAIGIIKVENKGRQNRRFVLGFLD